MKFRLIIVAFCLCFVSQTSIAQWWYPEGAETFYSRAMPQINTRYTSWMNAVQTDIKSGKTKLDEVDDLGNKYGQQFNLLKTDVEGLVLFMMMQLSKSAEQDMRELMDDIREANAKKKKMRDALKLMKQRKSEMENRSRENYLSKTEYDSLRRLLNAVLTVTPIGAKTSNIKLDKNDPALKPPPAVQNIDISRLPITPAEFNDLLTNYRDRLDMMNEAGELQSLRLQMIMDRMSKMASMIANIMKSIAKTQDSIINNLK